MLKEKKSILWVFMLHRFSYFFSGGLLLFGSFLKDSLIFQKQLFMIGKQAVFLELIFFFF